MCFNCWCMYIYIIYVLNLAPLLCTKGLEIGFETVVKRCEVDSAWQLFRLRLPASGYAADLPVPVKLAQVLQLDKDSRWCCQKNTWYYDNVFGHCSSFLFVWVKNICVDIMWNVNIPTRSQVGGPTTIIPTIPMCPDWQQCDLFVLCEKASHGPSELHAKRTSRTGPEQLKILEHPNISWRSEPSLSYAFVAKEGARSGYTRGANPGLQESPTWNM